MTVVVSVFGSAVRHERLASSSAHFFPLRDVKRDGLMASTFGPAIQRCNHKVLDARGTAGLWSRVQPDS